MYVARLLTSSQNEGGCEQVGSIMMRENFDITLPVKVSNSFPICLCKFNFVRMPLKLVKNLYMWYGTIDYSCADIQ